MTVYARPGSADSSIEVKDRYEHYIGGEWVAPVKGDYFENITPVTGQVFTRIARGTAEDIDAALDAAHRAADAWGKTSATERSNILLAIADRIQANLTDIAVAETWDNGKAVRETLNADIPLAIDHFRYFAGCIRAQEGGISQIDETTVAYHFHEPLGVVGQIIPWNFPILMAVWKLAPALAAGNCVVLKPAEQTPWSILKLFEIIGDLLPAGVVNIVNGFGVEAGKPLASSPRIAKIAFTGETTTGRLIMQYASQNIIPVTLELGGKSPNIFFEDIAESKDAFYDKALEGFAFFALNSGEVCTCPSRALIQASIYDGFLADGIERVRAVKQGDPLDDTTMMGAQASNDQFEKILSYIDIGRQEGATVLTGLHGNISIPRRTGSTTTGWVAENAALTPADPTFDSVTLAPKHAGAIHEWSRNMIQQSSPDVEQLARNDLALQLAEALDLAAINGSGASNQPLGILGTAGIGSVAIGANGGPITWNSVVDLMAEVEIDNAEGTGFLTNTKVVKSGRKTLKVSGDAGAGFIIEGSENLAGYPLAVTNLVPSNLTKGTSTGVCSPLIFGNWSDLLIGVWSELDILVNPYESTAYSKGNVSIRAMMTVDIDVRHPESFAAIQDLTTP